MKQYTDWLTCGNTLSVISQLCCCLDTESIVSNLEVLHCSTLIFTELLSYKNSLASHPDDELILQLTFYFLAVARWSLRYKLRPRVGQSIRSSDSHRLHSERVAQSARCKCTTWLLCTALIYFTRNCMGDSVVLFIGIDLYADMTAVL